MKYRAEWNTLSGELKVFEDDNVLMNWTAHTTVEAAGLVKEEGFWFTDLWSRSEGDVFEAPLKAVEKDA